MDFVIVPRMTGATCGGLVTTSLVVWFGASKHAVKYRLVNEIVRYLKNKPTCCSLLKPDPLKAEFRTV